MELKDDDKISNNINNNDFKLNQLISSNSSKLLLNNNNNNKLCFNNSLIYSLNDSSTSISTTNNDVIMSMINTKLESETISKPLCALCHCDGNNNALGLTDLSLFELTSNSSSNLKYITVLRDELYKNINKDELTNHDEFKAIEKFKQFFKKKLNFMIDDSINLKELIQLGWPYNADLSLIFNENTNKVWLHKTCAKWLLADNNNDKQTSLDKLLVKSLIQKCSFCNNFGASISCTIKSCTKKYHLPCAFISGCFIETKKHELLCYDHLEGIEDLFKDVYCAICASFTCDKLNEQLICTNCGMNYHSSCISLKLEQANPLIRAGWQCPECKICQICSKLGDDSQVLVCDSCDKGYHMYCLKPPMTSIPQNGWKCPLCKINIDFIQTNMSSDDNKSETISLNDFYNQENSKSSINDDGASTVDSEITVQSDEFKNPLLKTSKSTSGKPSQIAKKKQIIKKSRSTTQKRSNEQSTGKLIQRSTSTRSTRSKRNDDDSLKTQLSSSQSTLDTLLDNNSNTNTRDEPTIGTVIRDEDDHHAVSVLVSLKDSFTLEQDMCISCGSFGRQDEGKLISCSQCGQSYHTYCAGINKLTKVILERGWRCLDCTICEGCGKATDEGRLLLCDDCDISYHLYCLNPPLDHVPEGNWKCNWCIKCTKCGSKQAGLTSDAEWKNNFQECSLCNSQQTCPICTRNYRDGEIILKCVNCERWSHGSCDGLMSEDDADRLSNDGYTCIYCIKKQQLNNLTVQIVPHQQKASTKQEPSPASSIDSSTLSPIQTQTNISIPPAKRGVLDDGIYLTDTGSAFIKKIKIKPPPLRPRNRQVPKIDVDVASPASSNDELNDLVSPNKESPSSDLNSKKKVIKKKPVKIGIGGFNIKTGRNRPRLPVVNDFDIDIESNNSNILNEAMDDGEKKKTNKKKKKSTIDETFPVYLREAFFGNDILEKSKHQSTQDIDENETANTSLAATTTKNSHQDQSCFIQIDSNIIKQSQAKRKNNNLDLDLDELFDGELLNDILKDNRIEKHSNDEKIMKIFDDNTYEDFLNQIGGLPNDTVSDTDLLNTVTPNVSLFQTSFTSNNSDINKSLNQSTIAQQASSINDVDMESQQQQQQQPSIQVQLIQTTDSVETKQISDFARHLKESTHQYALINQSNQQDTQIMQMQQQPQHRPPISLIPQYQPHFPTHQQQQQNPHFQTQRFNQPQITLNNQNLLIHMQNDYHPNGGDVIHMIQPQQQGGNTYIPIQQTIIHSQQRPILGPNGAPMRMFAPPAPPPSNVPQTNPHMVHQQPPQQPQQQIVLNIDPNFHQSQNEYQIMHHQSTSPRNIVNSPQQNAEKPLFSPKKQADAVDEATKQKNILEKFQMDEDLGEFATQAMTLYSNLNFPQLKTQYPSIKDRLKYVQKMWRKLDSSTKTNYVNRAKQNRCKKKSEDKIANAGAKNSTRKRSKSPANSDKLSFSDADNLSRAETPSALDSNMDPASENSLMRMKSMEHSNQELMESQQQLLQAYQQPHQTDYHQHQVHPQQSQYPPATHQSQQHVTIQNQMQHHQSQQFRFNSPNKASPIKQTPQQFIPRIQNPAQQQVLYQLHHHHDNPPPYQQTIINQQLSPHQQQIDWSPHQSQAQQAQRSTSCHEYLVPTPPQRQFSVQNSPMPEANSYSQPKTPSNQAQQQLCTPLGSPHPTVNQQQQQQQQQQDLLAKKQSPFSRPPSTPHSEHSFNQQQQMIDSSYHAQPLTSPRARPLMVQNTYYQQIKTNSPSGGYPQHVIQSQLMPVQSPQPQYPLLSPVNQQQQRMFMPQQHQQQQAHPNGQQILIQTSPHMRMPIQRPPMISPSMIHMDQSSYQYQHNQQIMIQSQQQQQQQPRFQALPSMPPPQQPSIPQQHHQHEDFHLKQEQNEDNKQSLSSNTDEIFNHIDEVINDVVAGAGTIPYSTEFSIEDPENSNMSGSSSALLTNLLETNSNIDQSAPNNSTDLTQHQKQLDFPPTDDPIDKKVYSILMQAKQEQQNNMRQPQMPHPLPQQQQSPQQQYVYLTNQPQQRYPVMVKPTMPQQQQQPQMRPQFRMQPPPMPQQNLSIILNRQPSDTQIDPNIDQQQQVATSDDSRLKELTDRITQIEKEISSMKRKRTDLNKKNKLLLNVCTKDPNSDATTIVQLQLHDLNEQQQQKYSFNTQEIDRISANITNSQAKVEELKNEHKLIIQKVEKAKFDNNGSVGNKSDVIDSQKIKDSIQQKIMVGRLATTEQQNQQQQLQMDNNDSDLVANQSKKKQTPKKRQPKKELLVNQQQQASQQGDLNFNLNQNQGQLISLDFQLESQTPPPQPLQQQQQSFQTIQPPQHQQQQYFLIQQHQQQQQQQQQQQIIRKPTPPIGFNQNQYINQMLINRQQQQYQDKSKCQDENLRKMLMSSSFETSDISLSQTTNFDDKPNVEQMLNIQDNKRSSSQLLESMQLDGSIDQFLTEDQPQTTHLSNTHASVSTSASSSSSSLINTKRDDNNITYLTYKVVRQNQSNDANENQVQQIVKINQPVILNHELLANYGVTIQQQPTNNIRPSNSAENFVNLNQIQIKNQQVLQQNQPIPQQIRPQMSNLNHSNGQTKQKKIKTIRDEVMMNTIQANSGNIQQQQQQNQPIPQQFSLQNQIIQQKQQSNQIQQPPTSQFQGQFIGGDNTLLKQLLQTAPKNAPDNQKPQQQSASHISQQFQQQQINQQLSQQNVEQFFQNKQQSQSSVEIKVENQPGPVPAPVQHQPPQTVAQMINNSSYNNQQVKQEEPKVAVVKKRVRKAKNEDDDIGDNNEPKRSRKKQTPKIKNSENELNILIDQLKSLPQLQLNHPYVDVSNLPIIIPGRNKNNKLTKINYKNISYGYLTEDDINASLSTLDTKKQKENQIPNGDIEAHKVVIRNHLEKKFKICNAIIDTQPEFPLKANKIVNSIQRIKNSFIKPLSPSSETVISTSSIEDDDYASYDQNQFYLNSIFDPKINLKKKVFQRIKDEDDDDQVVDFNSTLDTIKEELSEQQNDDQRVSVTLTISKETTNNLASLFAALDELMLFRRPKTWDLGTLSTIPEQLTVNGPTKNNISSNKINRETATNVNHLNNIKQCKYCESFLINDQEIVSKKSTDICKKSSSKHKNEPSSSSIASSSTESIETIYSFCSQHCLNTYEHSIYLQSKQQQQFKSNDDIDYQPNGSLNGASCSNSLLLNADLFTTDETTESTSMCLRRQSKRKYTDSLLKPPPEKRWKGIKWKKFESSSLQKTPSKQNSPKKEIDELYNRLNTNVSVQDRPIVDKRVCGFCQVNGDCDTNGPGRLLVLDVDQWCHLNCALWSNEVYETMNGALINVDVAYKRSQNIECILCHRKGASIKCFNSKCASYYHLSCAVRDKSVFYQDKTFYCHYHASKTSNEGLLSDLSVYRKVWIQRNEINQIQNCMSPDCDDVPYTIRIGSLILYDIGQLLPHQLNSSNFHTREFIYPVGYKATRFYWSYKQSNKRCRYQCMITELDNKPLFTITVLEDGFDAETYTESSPKELWGKILQKIEQLRKNNDMVNLFSVFFSGEFLFGLTEPHIIRLIESLPGVETLTNYAFKFGKLQLLDMPLTINPTGCARSEPKLSTHFRRSKTLTCNQKPISSSVSKGFSNDDSSNTTNSQLSISTSSGSQLVPYTKQFTLSKSTQYKKLKTEWRQNVYLAKSRIQGLGLFAARDLEKNTMIIEYIGESIRNEVANRREKLYEQQNRGIYMFRIDDDFVIDATISGGLARYVNHCCDPNCIAETVKLEKESKIVIIANKRINKGEELTYDYKFDYEDESNKIPCLCGAVNCHKWMN